MSQNNFAAITSASVHSTSVHSTGVHSTSVHNNLIMFLSPPEAAAIQLAHDITPKLIHDIYGSLPAGAIPEATVTDLMDQLKSALLTGKGLSDGLGALDGLITDSTAAPASAAAGKQLVGLITGSMVKDIITIVAPTISTHEIRSSIHELKRELNAGLGFEPWLKSMVTVFSALNTHTHAL